MNIRVKSSVIRKGNFLVIFNNFQNWGPLLMVHACPSVHVVGLSLFYLSSSIYYFLRICVTFL